MGDVDAAVAEWIDRLAVQDLVVRYSDAATRGDWDAFGKLWTEDAVWEVGPPVGTRHVGAQVICDTVKASVDSQDFLVQMVHGAVVTLHGDGRASATTTIHAIARREGHHHFTNYGVYFDEMVKVDGEWRFSRRNLQPVYSDSGPLPGVSPISRADLSRLP